MRSTCATACAADSLDDDGDLVGHADELGQRASFAGERVEALDIPSQSGG